MSTDLKFVRFNETNDHEGETWTFWLQVNGNEDQLDKLWNLLDEANVDGDEDFDFELFNHAEQTVPEEHVDALVEHGNRDGYMAEHHKVTGKLVCPDSIGEYGDVLYKGDITKLFTVKVRDV